MLGTTITYIVLYVLFVGVVFHMVRAEKPKLPKWGKRCIIALAPLSFAVLSICMAIDVIVFVITFLVCPIAVTTAGATSRLMRFLGSNE